MFSARLCLNRCSVSVCPFIGLNTSILNDADRCCAWKYYDNKSLIFDLVSMRCRFWHEQHGYLPLECSGRQGVFIVVHLLMLYSAAWLGALACDTNVCHVYLAGSLCTHTTSRGAGEPQLFEAVHILPERQ